MQKLFLGLLIGFLFLSPALAQDNDKLSVLCIGNSYINRCSKMMTGLAKANELNIQFEYVTPGGYMLHRHAKNKKLIERISNGSYDVVILQEQSQLPALLEEHVDTFHNGAKALHAAIAESGAKTAFFVTWGRRDGDKANRTINPDFETMQSRLDTAYNTIIGELNAVKIPVGPAWAQTKQNNEQLWRKLYGNDGSHPSQHGAYLSSLVIFSTLLDIDPASVTESPNIKGLEEDSLNGLSTIASQIHQEQK